MTEQIEQIEQRTRIFVFGEDHAWADPGPQFSNDDVRKHLSAFFPELANADVALSTDDAGRQVVTFKKRAGTKGCRKMRQHFRVSLPAFAWIVLCALVLGTLALLVGHLAGLDVPWKVAAPGAPGTVSFHGAPPGGETVIYRAVDCDTGVVLFISESGDVAAVPGHQTWIDVAGRCAAGQGLSQ